MICSTLDLLIAYERLVLFSGMYCQDFMTKKPQMRKYCRSFELRCGRHYSIVGSLNYNNRHSLACQDEVRFWGFEIWSLLLMRKPIKDKASSIRPPPAVIDNLRLHGLDCIVPVQQMLPAHHHLQHTVDFITVLLVSCANLWKNREQLSPTSHHPGSSRTVMLAQRALS
jgi:hypothetical protein